MSLLKTAASTAVTAIRTASSAGGVSARAPMRRVTQS